MPHFATRQGTSEYFANHSLPVRPRQLGKTGWSVSPVGFGTYRVQDDSLDHHQALKLALQSGCNLIDTSTNYTDGASERLVGQVLHELIHENLIRRDQVVIVTKAGYVQGENYQLAAEKEKAGTPFTDMVHFQPDLWHCISPDFLEEQITRSLERMKIATLDVLLLHNPEYFLKKEHDHRAYYERIKKAFAHLETEVKRGRIQYYGISSNTFPEPKEAPNFTSLQAVLDAADEIASENHFAVIQFPMNLFEPGAVLESNNEGGKTVAELALSRGLGTLVNRPLNAFGEQGMIRLADFPQHDDETTLNQLKNSFKKTMELEAKYPEAAKSIVPLNRIAWGHILSQNFERVADVESWKGALGYQILPSRNEALELLEGDSALHSWTREYRDSSDLLFSALTANLESQSAMRSHRLCEILDQTVPELGTSQTLSQKVIRLYLSFPGIHCILVGMRQEAYVLDALGVQPAVSTENAIEAIEAVFKEAPKN